MIAIQRPGTSPLERNISSLISKERLPPTGGFNPKAKDRINLLAKRLKVTIFARSERNGSNPFSGKLRPISSMFRRELLLRGNWTCSKRLGREKAVAIGNGADDIPVLQEAALGICILGREGLPEGLLQRPTWSSRISSTLSISCSNPFVRKQRSDFKEERKRVPGSGFRVPGSGFRVPGFRVPGSGFGISDLPILSLWAERGPNPASSLWGEWALREPQRY